MIKLRFNGARQSGCTLVGEFETHEDKNGKLPSNWRLKWYSNPVENLCLIDLTMNVVLTMHADLDHNFHNWYFNQFVSKLKDYIKYQRISFVDIKQPHIYSEPRCHLWSKYSWSLTDPKHLINGTNKLHL